MTLENTLAELESMFDESDLRPVYASLRADADADADAATKEPRLERGRP
jgi:hypothetical protein